jgi:hypothetical protein
MSTKGTARLQAVSPSTRGIKRLRAMMMLEQRVSGVPLLEIAKTFNISQDAVRDNLDWAAREGLIQQHEETILSSLVPKAIAAYEKALTAKDPDVFVAKDVIERMMRIAERIDKKQEHKEEFGLSAFLRLRKVGLNAQSSTTEKSDTLSGDEFSITEIPRDASVEAENIDASIDQRRIQASTVATSDGPDAASYAPTAPTTSAD